MASGASRLAIWKTANHAAILPMDTSCRAGERNARPTILADLRNQGRLFMLGTKQGLAIGVLLALGTTLGGLPSRAQPVDTARIAAGGPNDWLTYHGAYNGWNYIGLDHIKTHT